MKITHAQPDKPEKMRMVWRYIITCAIVSVVVAPVMNKNLFQDVENFLLTIFFGLFYSLSGLYGTFWLFKYLDKKYDWINDSWKRLIIGIGAVVVWSLLIYVMVTPFLLWLFGDPSWENMLKEMKANLLYPPIMGVSGMIIIASVEFFKNWKNSFIKKENLQAEMMSYKYEALHNQLNPHFLFNSFNVLSGLVYEDQALAVKFIDQLSDLYEKVLHGKHKELIPLQDELEFIQNYIFLLKTRFEDKLEVHVDLQPNDDEWIAPMVLQLLLENAVKHNRISKAEPLNIYVKKVGDVIEVSNNLRIKKAGDYSKGTGLQNIRQRYSFFTNRPIEVQQTNDQFLVSVPVLHKAIIV